jgi:putative transposase
VLQDTLRRLDKAFQAFFRRAKVGQKAGYPRFKSARRFDSFCYPQYKGSVGQHVYLPKIGNVRLRLHRPLERPCSARIKTLTVKREVDEWYAVIVCEVETKPLPATGNMVGVDLGIAHFLVTSDGEFVDNPRYFQKTLKKLRRAQRALARKKKGSKRCAKQRERVAKLHRKVKRQRLDFHHKTARKLVNENDAIAFENLNVKGMVRSNLARSISDAGWSQFIGILVSKAEEAGRRAITDHPAYSSQRCNGCGYVDCANRPSQAVFRCQNCGHTENADWNAAKNIRAWITPSESLARQG